jgi:beta-lactamase superfamily II metal-dependent hydrolase
MRQQQKDMGICRHSRNGDNYCHYVHLHELFCERALNPKSKTATGTKVEHDTRRATSHEPNSDFTKKVTVTIPLSNGVNLSTSDAMNGDKSSNNNSVISVLDVDGKKALVTGDAETKTERLHAGLIADIDVYVVGHHGSETSSSQAFLDEMRPAYGRIGSQGLSNGSYNNTDDRLPKRLNALGTEMYVTYRSGTIVTTISGGAIYRCRYHPSSA